MNHATTKFASSMQKGAEKHNGYNNKSGIALTLGPLLQKRCKITLGNKQRVVEARLNASSTHHKGN